MYKLVVFDVAGTIVSDDGIVLDCFEAAFREVVPEAWSANSERFIAYAQKTMGQSKVEVFFSLLGDLRLATAAADKFQNHYLANLHRVHPLEGVDSMFRMLKAQGVKIALNTGFDRHTLDTMIAQYGWASLIDDSATPGEAGGGRPSTAMLELVSRRLGITDRDTVAVLGDTATDVETAAIFGAGLKIGVLTGAHGVEELELAGADLVVPAAPDATVALLS
jgi:phosphoglycolate phosphatase